VGNTSEPTPGKCKEPDWPDQGSEDNDNQSEDDDTRALKWLTMCSTQELATEHVRPPFGI